jgi:NAD-reducing hydrogenase small subunit
MARLMRQRSKTLVSFGDCAVTGNVTAIRNCLGSPEVILKRSYLELADLRPSLPKDPGVLPELVDRVRPLHEVVPVDFWIPGCPPPAERIRAVLEALLDGRQPQLEGSEIRFG